jgi:two-component system, sensor histidine kinase LadS
MKFPNYLFLFFIFFTQILNGKSLQLDSKQKEFPIREFLFVYEDKNNQYTINEKNNIPFHKTSEQVPNFGFTKSSVWLRVDLLNSNDTSETFTLEFTEPQVDYFQVWIETEKGNKYHFKGGDFEKFSIRPIQYHNFLFPFTLDKNEKASIYLYFNPGYIIVPLNLYSATGLSESISKDRTIQGFYYGFMIVMILYNLFLYISIKDKSYLYYCLYILSYLGIQSNMSGISYEFLWPDYPWWGNHSAAFFECLTLVFAGQFFRNFLNLKVHLPRYDTFMIIYIYAALAMTFISLMIPINLAMPICHFFVILIIPFIFIITYKMIRIFRPARFFALAWIVLTVGAMFNVLRALGLLPQNILTNYGVQVGSALEVLFLSFSLADRINLFKKEKDEAQKNALELQEKSNKELEEKVRERTKLLQNTLGVIQKDLILAKKIQEGILPNLNFKRDLFHMKVLYEPRDGIGGDFYHIDEFENGKIRILIADATGHGIQAAMVVMVIQGLYEPFKQSDKTPGEILTELNDSFINRYLKLNTYFTAVLFDIDPNLKKLRYSSAGHPEQIILHKGQLSTLPKTGKLMGWLKSEYKTIEKEFDEDTKLLLFSDGIFEEFNESNEEFGLDRMIGWMEMNKNKSVSELIIDFRKELNDFCSKKDIEDDITFLGIQLKRNN